MSKEELKAEVSELLNSDEFEDTIRDDMFHGYTLRSSYASGADLLPAEKLDEAGIQEKLEDHFGGEGMGDEYWSVWSFIRGSDTVFVQFDGSYVSYDGSTYDSWFFVEPEEYVAVRYNKID